MKSILIDVINKNRVKVLYEDTVINYKHIFTAGSSIYAAPWSRDFLYSAPILMKNDEWRETVSEHFYLIYFNKKKNFLPKGLDTMWFDWRIVKAFIRNITCQKSKKDPLKGILKPYYSDSLFSNPIDTNLLFLNAAIELYNYSDNKEFIVEIKDDLIDILNYYDDNNLIKDMLITQNRFSDWKDTLNRSGTAFITNMLYWKVVKDMKESKLFGYKLKVVPDELHFKIHDTFFKNGVYISMKDKKYIGIDENLLAIEWGFSKDPYMLFEQLRNRKELWINYLITSNERKIKIPGPPIVPKYPLYKKSPFTVFAGAKDYHDKCVWSWIIGLYGKVCYKLGKVNEGDLVYDMMKNIILKDKTVYDAYKFKKKYSFFNILSQFKSWGFKSEHDWLWGASYILDMVNEREKI